MLFASRLDTIQPGIFSKISDLKNEVQQTGVNVIDLSVGSPDMAPPPHVKDALVQAINNDKNYGYTLTEGITELKKAVINWYNNNYQVELTQEEILSLMGSQDGIAHIFWAILNPGDIALVPDPGYPIYHSGALLAGGELYHMPLLEENNYLPNLSEIPEDILKRAKIMILNYPSNPHAATANPDFFYEVVSFAKKHNIIVCHDFAYSELSYDGFKNTSFLQIPGAKEVGVEFHSISKTFNLAGCRLGVISGNKEIVNALRKVKSNIDYGIFRPIQIAAATALNGPSQCIRDNAMAYQKRRDIFIDELASYGWEIKKPKASMFIWAKIPKQFTSSEEFAFNLIRQAGVAVVPGIAFGKYGEGYVRIGLVQDSKNIKEAAHRIGNYITSQNKQE